MVTALEGDELKFNPTPLNCTRSFTSHVQVIPAAGHCPMSAYGRKHVSLRRPTPSSAGARLQPGSTGSLTQSWHLRAAADDGTMPALLLAE